MKKPFKHLYIHVPFCASKCAYCAFYSSIDSGDLVNDYLNKIQEDFILHSSQCTTLKSVFLGGGTPTLLTATELDTLFSSITNNFTLDSECEISIECNPETLTSEKAKVIAHYATRVSMGVQTFNQKHRKAIGRQGDVNAVFTAIEQLHQNNFTNIGVDLIYAIPGQTIADWKEDLVKAAELDTPHISAYSLSIDEGSALANGRSEEARDDISCDMWDEAKSVLNKYGFDRYEISNYSKPGQNCVHNTNIWYGDPYLGCGPSAVSFDGVRRWEQPANLKEWLNDGDKIIDDITPESRAREIFIMGLRTIKGWSKQQFIDQTGFDYTPWLKNLQQFSNFGFITLTQSNISLTTEGQAFWNTVGEELV